MGTLTVQHIDSNRSYVTGGDFNCMVDLEKRSCTSTLVDPLYTKGYLVEAYTDPINPTDEDLIPPMYLVKCVCHPQLENNAGDRR
ncbi:hypothetical protein F2Q70_00036557 [Brassica cretica]|uniref:Uncharacterized protein n=1 Tax=Brassica cretica TaxID=69181 RepID=A0A8S9JNG9_BRACR|nr:hypothetical protein F2Q70_00036557 [Brassica cretica]